MQKIKRIILFPIFLVFYEFILYLSNDAYLPALPQISHDLMTTHNLVQATITTWFLGACFMQLILGPIADRYGRRPVLLMGGIIFIASTLGCGHTTNITVLLLCRFLQGMSITSMQVAGYATIHELFDQEKAIHTIAMMNSITVLAPALGPLLGAFALYFYGWRWIFFILAFLSLIAIISLFFDMPETLENKFEHTLNFKIILIQYYRIISNPTFILYTISYCLLFCAMIAWIATSPFLIMTEYHFSSFVFGITQALIFGSLILGTRLVKPATKKISVQHLMQIGILISFIGGLSALLFSIFIPQYIACIIFAMMLLAGGSGFAMPIFNRLIVESSQEPMGSRIAIFSFSIALFGMLGSFIISLVYNGHAVSLTILLFLLCLLSVFAYLLTKLNKAIN